MTMPSLHRLFLLLCFTRLLSNACTATNKLIIEKAGVVQANKEYFSFADMNVDQYPDGKYGLSGNFAIIQDIPNSTVVIGKIKNFIDHKYELVGDSDGKNLCKFFEDEYNDWFSVEYLKNQHWFSGCPVKQGTYWFKNFVPKDIKYPITELWSKSLSEITFYYNEVLLLHIKWYTTLVAQN